MWLMQDTLVRSTHQVAECFLFSDTTHCPPQALLSDFNPSTALVAFPVIDLSPVYGYCWYAGLFKAMFSTKQIISWYTYNFVLHKPIDLCNNKTGLLINQTLYSVFPSDAYLSNTTYMSMKSIFVILSLTRFCSQV